MALYGAAGFPLLNGIPRGESFVDFMTRGSGPVSSNASTPVNIPSQGGSTGSQGAETAPELTWTELSSSKTDLGGGVMQTNDVKRSDVDGAVRTSTRTAFPDGTAKISSVRRSLPDADGIETIRVFETNVAADGTKQVDMQVFKVPAGTVMDWSSDAAQKYFSHTTSKTIPPGLTWEDVPPDAPKEPEAPTVADTRPIIPSAV